MPKLQVPRKLKPVLTTKKRFVILIGGRGSTKSETVGRVLVMRSQTEAADILCGREYQNSIEDSVHKIIKDLIGRLEVSGFGVTDKKIDSATGGGFRFKGFSRNPDAVKSAQGFKYSWVEEAQSLSKESLKELTPTIRAEGSQIFFTANPGSSEDPFSVRFINPFLSQLKANDGIYEDDLHLIIMINWRDNPWFPPELELERKWDYDNLSRAEYDHIWEGEFNDHVEGSLIKREWFDACIDAHKKLGFSPIGARMAAHDPSDEGSDTKGYAFRHGSVVLDVQEKTAGNVNEGMDWAIDLALRDKVDVFTWDGDGMGLGLTPQVSKGFEGKHTVSVMFRGSEGPDNPESIYKPVENENIHDQRMVKDMVRNKRAQYYLELRDRVWNTYRAVVKREYVDPDNMISFSSDIKLINKLRSEMCRLPVKPNGSGRFGLYTKPEMKTKFKIASPNLSDPVMMLCRSTYKPEFHQVVRPQPIKVIRNR